MTALIWIGAILVFIACIGIIKGPTDIYRPVEEADDWANRLAALMIINDLKYTHPDTWAIAASDIMGKPVNPPTPEQCEEYFKAHPEKRKS